MRTTAWIQRNAIGVCILWATVVWADAEAPATLERAFFVHQAHPAASDANPGTHTEPWQTLGGNLARLRAGDTVYIQNGVYREQVILSRTAWRDPALGVDVPAVAAGESYARMIGFVAYPGHDVVIKGSDAVAGWEPYREAVWVKADWSHNSQQVFADGQILQQIAGEIAETCMPQHWLGRQGEGLEDLEPGSFFYDRESRALYVWLKDGGNPNERLMEVSVRPFLFLVRPGVDYVRISGLRMMHANASAVISWAAVSLAGQHGILEDVEVTWTDFGALSFGGSNNTAIRSRFNHNGNNGVGGGGWGHRLIDCETSHNNYRNWSPNWHAGGIKMVGQVRDIVVSGHTAAHNRNSCGIWFDWGMSQVTIRNSVVHDNGHSGILYEIGNRGVIKNNIAYRNGQRGIWVAASSDTLVAHNLVVENGMSGIAVTGGNRHGRLYGREEDDVLWTRNNTVWGNLMVDNCWDGARDLERWPDWGDRPELILPDDDHPAGFNNISDYNLFHRSDGRPIPFWRGWQSAAYPDLEAWQATGNDRHSIVAEPRFTDRKIRDYRPAPDSPAIGLVRPRMGLLLDADGRYRSPEHPRTAGPFERPPGDD